MIENNERVIRTRITIISIRAGLTKGPYMTGALSRRKKRNNNVNELTTPWNVTTVVQIVLVLVLQKISKKYKYYFYDYYYQR